VTGAVTREATAPLYLDLHLPAGAHFIQPLPAEHNGFVYVYRGTVLIAGTEVSAGRMAILKNEGDGLVIEALEDARGILVAGRPLGEPIAQYGPFVMNTQAEIQQTLADFREGRLA
jgi:hypothetical protein